MKLKIDFHVLLKYRDRVCQSVTAFLHLSSRFDAVSCAKKALRTDCLAAKKRMMVPGKVVGKGGRGIFKVCFGISLEWLRKSTRTTYLQFAIPFSCLSQVLYVSPNLTVFWDVALCNFLVLYQCLEEPGTTVVSCVFL